MKNSYVKTVMGIVVLITAFALSTNAQIHSTTGGGPWDNTWTWVGGTVPGIANDVVINGPVHTSGSFCNSLTLNTSGSLNNTYYGATLTVTGDVTNHGTISDYVSNFNLNIGGDITNNGVWNNSYTTLTGSTNHVIACQNGNGFSGYQFQNTGTGNMFINTEAYFDNVRIHLNNLNLSLAENATLKIHDGYLYQCNVIGAGATSVVFGEGVFDSDAPYHDHVSFTDISFQGDNNIGSTCSTNGIVINDGFLQNDYYGQTLVANDIFINNGTIQNFVSGFNIYLYGDFTNNGTLINSEIRLYGTADQTLTELNNNTYNLSYLSSYKPSGKIVVLTDIDFLGCQVNMQNDTIIVQNNGVLKFDGSNIQNAVVMANDAKSGNLKLDMNETSYISNCDVFNPEILGKVKAKGNNFYGDILITDTLENDYFGYTVNIYGNLTNNGVIQNFISDLVLNIEGDIINNGIWNNSYNNLIGSTDQHIECTNGNKFSGYQINNNNASGDIIVDNTVYFDNVRLHFNNHNLILPSNTLLKMHDGYLYQCNLSGSGETSVVNGEGVFDGDAPYYQDVSFADISFQGDNNIAPGCSTHGTVINNGSLQNNYFGYTIDVNDNFINNGTIQNWVDGFTFNVYGNLENNGVWDNTTIGFYGTNDQEVFLDAGQVFSPSYFYSYKPSGKIIALSDLAFDNVDIHLEHDTLIMPDNSTLSLSGNRLYRADIHATTGRFNLFMENSAYIHESNLTDVGLTGTIECNNANVFYGTTINDGTFQNDYYSYTTVFNGDFINNGIIKNDVSHLTMNMYGNIENNGIWDNTTIGLYSPDDQEVFLDEGQVFSPSYFYSYKPSGKIIALTDLSFDNVDINLEHDTLIMPDNSTLALSSNRLYRTDIHAATGRFNLFMENDAYLLESNLQDVTLFGTIDCNNGNTFNGTTINEGVFQNNYYSYWVTFTGDIINNNTIQQYVSSFYINIEGDITNNGAWTNYFTQMNGTTDQYVHLKNGHWIDGRMLFVSDINVSPFNWFWNGWDIENPPYPQPAVWSGEGSNALNFLVPVANNRLGTYYCSTGGGASRNIIVDEVSSMRINITALFEGPFNGTDMNDDLNALLPSHQPYNSSPWDYAGAESVASIPANAVDWLLVELRDAADVNSATSATSLGGQAAFILRDGSIVDLDGSSLLSFDYTITQNLFIVLWHRNHLPIVSEYPLAESDGIYTYNFTTAASQAYGDNQSDLGGGKFGMIAGDANADGTVNELDGLEAWYLQVGNQGYYSADVNMDIHVNNPDKNDIWLPNYNKTEVLP